MSSKRSRKKSKYQKKVPTISQTHNISQKNVTIYIILYYFWNAWKKKRFYIDSDVFLADSVDLADSWHFFLIVWFFFWQSLEFAPPPASAAATAARGGSRNCGEKRARKIWNRWWKQNLNIQNKVRNTQPNPHYSAKNNVTIHVIVPFMPK